VSVAAKIVVTESKGGSRISLLGASGKELLGSSVFFEPRAKGATLRALRGLLGEVVVEDHTLAARAKPGAVKTAAAEAPAPAGRRPGGHQSRAPAKKAVTPTPSKHQSRRRRAYSCSGHCARGSSRSQAGPQGTAPPRHQSLITGAQETKKHCTTTSGSAEPGRG